MAGVVKQWVAMLFTTVVVMHAIGPSASAQIDTGTKARLDQLIDRWSSLDSPGVAMAIVKDGEVVYSEGRGSANLEYDIPITGQTVFDIASLSKQFTAFAIHKLVQEGHFGMDDDIRWYLPELPDFRHRITIASLLHHTSGLRDQFELLSIAGWRADDVITIDHVKNLIYKQRDLNFIPGSDYLYSNTGYTVLAMLVEKVTNKPFAEYLQDTVFEPLGMTHTAVNVDHQSIIRNRAYSYQRGNDREVKKAVLSYANIGATSMYATVADLAQWLINYETFWVGNPELFNDMFTSGQTTDGADTAYGSGLHVDQYGNNKIVSHSGSDAGYKSFMAWYPEQRLGIVVLSNWKDFAPSTIAARAANYFIDDELRFSLRGNQEASVTVQPEALANYVGYYQLQPGWILDISLSGEQLQSMATLERPFDMTAVSPTKFFVQAYQDFIEFVPDQYGHVHGLVYKGINAERVAKVVPSAAELERFTGEYYSPELETSYRVYTQDGKLHVDHQRNETVVLEPTTFDQFYGDKWWFFGVQFVRDSSGEVSGFELWGGRVHRLKFHKRTDPSSLG